MMMVMMIIIVKITLFYGFISSSLDLQLLICQFTISVLIYINNSFKSLRIQVWRKQDIDPSPWLGSLFSTPI